MEMTATVRFVRQSPRKMRLLADVIRGKDVLTARAELVHTPKRAGTVLAKLLASAVANAKHLAKLSEKDLRIARVTVNPGSTLKRFTPRAFGRAFPILRRSCHVTLILESVGENKKGRNARKTLQSQDQKKSEKS